MNPGPLALESTALPTELSRLDGLLVEIRAKLRILASKSNLTFRNTEKKFPHPRKKAITYRKLYLLKFVIFQYLEIG